VVLLFYWQGLVEVSVAYRCVWWKYTKAFLTSRCERLFWWCI